MVRYLESHSIFILTPETLTCTKDALIQGLQALQGFSLTVMCLSFLVYRHTSSQCLWVSILRRNLASLRIIPNSLPARRVTLYIIINTRKGPARRIQRDRPIPKDGIRERLIEIDRVPLTITVRQDQRLRDELVERVRRVG